MASYVSFYPTEYSANTVKATSYAGMGYEEWNMFDTANSLTGPYLNNQWISANTSQNQRCNVNYIYGGGSAARAERVYVENTHNSGTQTTLASKRVHLYGSNDSGEFTDTDAYTVAGPFYDISFEVGTGTGGRDRILSTSRFSGTPDLQTGDKIYIVGSASNDGEYEILDKISISELEVAAGSLVNEAAGAGIEFHETTTRDYLGSFNFAEHVAADTVDPQYFTLTNTGTYGYYSFVTATRWGSYAGSRRIELQINEAGDGTLDIPPVEMSGYGGGFGGIDLAAVELSGSGGGAGSLALPSISVSGAGGGVGSLALGEITMTGTGDDSSPLTLDGSLGLTFTSDISIVSHSALDLAGTLNLEFSGGFNIDTFELYSDPLFEIDGGFSVEVHPQAELTGLLFSLEGSFAVETKKSIILTSNLGISFTGGFGISTDTPIYVSGQLGFYLSGGFSIKEHEGSAELTGTLFDKLSGSFGIDSNTPCAGVVSFTEETRC